MTLRLPFTFSHCRRTDRAARAAVLGICLVLLATVRVGAQNTPGVQHPLSSMPTGQHPGVDPNEDTPIMQAIEEEKALRALNEARQKSMVADAARLVRLVNELNAEIVRTNPDSLTAAQLRKVAEIEKLAHNVKDKMSTSVRGMPAFPEPHFPQR
jgi:hypothetical protein